MSGASRRMYMNEKTTGISIGLRLAYIGYKEDSYTINELVKLAKRLRTYYTHSCNGYNYEKYDRLAEKLEIKIKEIAQGVHLYVYFQTDPRGGTLYVAMKPIDQQTYTRDGVYLE